MLENWYIYSINLDIFIGKLLLLLANHKIIICFAGMHNTTVYTLFNLFQQNICYSCGSYQCPYCPYFNVAAAIKATVTLFCLIVGFAVKRFLLHSWDFNLFTLIPVYHHVCNWYQEKNVDILKAFAGSLFCICWICFW